MLKNINPLLTGEILAALAEMGHGDEVAIVDANYPARSNNPNVIEVAGASATDMLQAVLTVLPLDDFVEQPAGVMDAPSGRPAIFAEFQRYLDEGEGRSVSMESIERFAFYERSRKAYAVVLTGERRLYGNIILKKGVVRA
jgi:L-fucose mutarotase